MLYGIIIITITIITSIVVKDLTVNDNTGSSAFCDAWGLPVVSSSLQNVLPKAEYLNATESSKIINSSNIHKIGNEKASLFWNTEYKNGFKIDTIIIQTTNPPSLSNTGGRLPLVNFHLILTAPETHSWST